MLKMAVDIERDGKKRRLVVLGLSHQNLDRLRAGQPIVFNGEDVGAPAIEVMIFAGETEQSMAREVAEVIGPTTDVKIDPRLRD